MEIELTKENYDGEVIKSNCANNLSNCRGIQR